MVSRAYALIPVSFNDETDSPKPTAEKNWFGLEAPKPIHLKFNTDLHQPSALLSILLSYSSSSTPNINCNTKQNFLLSQPYFRKKLFNFLKHIT